MRGVSQAGGDFVLVRALDRRDVVGVGHHETEYRVFVFAGLVRAALNRINVGDLVDQLFSVETKSKN